jgi:hypothetical protein
MFAIRDVLDLIIGRIQYIISKQQPANLMTSVETNKKCIYAQKPHMSGENEIF